MEPAVAAAPPNFLMSYLSHGEDKAATDGHQLGSSHASTYRSLTLRSNPLCLGSAFVVGLEVASATARSTRYAERPPSDRE